MYIYIHTYKYVHMTSSHAARIDFLDYLAVSPNHSSLVAGFPDYILCQYGVVGGSFLLVGQTLHIYVKGSIKEHYK